MPPMGQNPRRQFKQQPFDPLEWAAKNPQRVFKLAWIAVGVIVVIWGVLTSFYTVEANEEAVVLRFGKIHDVTGPGFHGKMPFGIDSVQKGEVKAVLREEFGYRTLSSGVQSQFDRTSREVIGEANMLTGDLNLALVSWEVRYRIKDLKSYLYKVRKPVETLRDVSQAVMRTAVGDRSVDEVLTEGRIEIETEVQERMQLILDAYECGLHVVKVNLGESSPPKEVRAAFDQVNQAKQFREQIINDAEAQRNKQIPVAEGQALRVVEEALGYELAQKNEAEGETSAFLAILKEYESAEDVTRRRLFIDAMEKLLPKVKEIVVIDGEGDGVLKLFDINRAGGR